ncbi:U6 snRNA phosphodiesterase [Folsomia candida]|uniref:Large ribosomal subunit protein P2 n=2 Tax=Folsomia candida TaxID=158441 RepID=A0A226EJ17_FOLCA|nr:U6 snRNA phosphodiesterase [Folsomia candida]
MSWETLRWVVKWKAVLVVGAKESLKDSESFYYFRLLLAILIPYILLKTLVILSQLEDMALNALKSLQSYGSDLSDNDESDDQNVINPLIAPDLNNMQSIAADPIMDKSKEKLPLPSSMLSMFPSSDSHPTNDDKEQHGGRIRSFPHMRGNWASFVHIPLNNSQNVICQIEHIKNVVVDIPDLEFHFCEDLHLSLSKTVVLRHHWIDSFLSTLKNNVTQINRFNLVYLTFQTYVNEEKTRTFISMNVHPSPQLYELVDASDRALAEYELPTYYEKGTGLLKKQQISWKTHEDTRMERITFGILDIPIDMRMFPHLNPVNPTMKILILILIVYASISDRAFGETLEFCESEELEVFPDYLDNGENCKIIDIYIISKSVLCEEEKAEALIPCSSDLLSTPTVFLTSFLNASNRETGPAYKEPLTFNDILTLHGVPAITLAKHQRTNTINDHWFRLMIKSSCEQQLVPKLCDKQWKSVLSTLCGLDEATWLRTWRISPALANSIHAEQVLDRRMRYVAAYLLAVLGQKSDPSAGDIEKILSSVGIEADKEKLQKVVSELKGKVLEDLLKEGQSKLASMPSGGGAAAAAAPAAAAAGGGDEKPKKEEKKKEESEEEDDDMGFGLFD